MRISIFTSIIAVGLLAACSTPADDAAKAQERAFEAQEKIARERLNLIEEFQDCVKKAEGDQLKISACDSYLDAAEALK